MWWDHEWLHAQEPGTAGKCSTTYLAVRAVRAEQSGCLPRVKFRGKSNREGTGGIELQRTRPHTTTHQRLQTNQAGTATIGISSFVPAGLVWLFGQGNILSRRAFLTIICSSLAWRSIFRKQCHGFACQVDKPISLLQPTRAIRESMTFAGHRIRTGSKSTRSWQCPLVCPKRPSRKTLAGPG
jgi:hypothetical protein